MKETSKTEAEINTVSEARALSDSKLQECANQKFEDQIERLMFAYEYYKIETYVLREKLASFRMAFHSRSRMRKMLDFYT